MDAVRINGTGICLECRRAFEPRRSDQKFCSHNCRSRYNNRINFGAREYRTAPPELKPPATAFCEECQKEFKVLRAGKRFCSDSCRGKHSARQVRLPKVAVEKLVISPPLERADIDAMLLGTSSVQKLAEELGATVTLENGYFSVTAPDGKVWVAMNERMLFDRQANEAELVRLMKRGLKDDTLEG